MKVVAVFQATVEVQVDLGEHETWEAAALAALDKALQPPPAPDVSLSLDRIWQDDGCQLTLGHEIVGLCFSCGEAIVDGCGISGCDGSGHAPDKGGWLSSKNGHIVWCSQECADGKAEA